MTLSGGRPFKILCYTTNSNALPANPTVIFNVVNLIDDDTLSGYC